MPKPTMVKRAALVGLVALVLAGCAGTASSSKSTQPVGEPWIDSNVKGVVTKDTQADVRSDYFVAKAKDWLANTKIPENVQATSTYEERRTQIMDELLALVDDGSMTDHDVTCMRNYFGLLGDWEARDAVGVAPVAAEVREVEAITTIDQMSDYLASETVRRRGNYIMDDEGEPAGESLVSMSISIADSGTSDFSLGVSTGSMFSTTAAETELSGSDLDYANSPFVKRATYMLGRVGYESTDADEMIRRVRDLEETVYAPVVAEYDRDTKALEAKGQADDEDAYPDHARAVTRDELAQLAGNFPILRLLDAYGYGDATTLEALEPTWLSSLGRAYTQDNLEALKGRAILGILIDNMDYLDTAAADKSYECAELELEVDAWLASEGEEGAGNAAAADDLPAEFVEPMSEAQQARYYDIETVMNDMPGVVTNAYVAHCYSPSAQSRALELTNMIIGAYREIVSQEDWLDPETRDRAIEKLNDIEINIGYPSTLGNTAMLEIPTPGPGVSLYDAAKALRAYDVDQTRRAISNPDESTYWQNPMEVNAFYMGDENAIFVGCGIIGGRLFDENASVEEQLATFGTTVGHELTHAFDDEGARYDKDGNLTNWWTAGDLADFNARADKVRKYLGTIKPLGTDAYDGDYVDSEMISDMGGLKAALTVGHGIEGFDFRRFFDAYVIGWESVGSYASVEETFASDSHPLDATRANVSVMQVQEFYDVYGIQPGDKMYLAPEDRIAVW